MSEHICVVLMYNVVVLGAAYVTEESLVGPSPLSTVYDDPHAHHYCNDELLCVCIERYRHVFTHCVYSFRVYSAVQHTADYVQRVYIDVSALNNISLTVFTYMCTPGMLRPRGPCGQIIWPQLQVCPLFHAYVYDLWCVSMVCL